MAPHRAGPRSGFTLFEVVISMLVLSIAVLATIALLPVGLKAQQLARYQLFASASAMTLMENFHSPLVSFKGHGSLAPALGSNLAASPNDPPIPGWASRLRETNLHGAPYQHDIERYLCGWMTGVMPVPDAIARRIDSDGDEIQRLLDAGGYLLYRDVGYVRGLTVAANRDSAMTLQPAAEEQKLVFAVTGYAQQNALTSHPVESWPWYEMYPFPPAWVALRASGHEVRRGPISLMHRIHPTDPALDSWGSTRQGQNLYGGVSTAYSDGAGPGLWRDGLCFGDGGHVGWKLVTFPKAPQNANHLSPPKSSVYPNPVTDQSVNPIDRPDPPTVAADPPKGGTTGWYQGRNWRHFRERFGAGTPWDAGWTAFQRLAGFNDAHRDLSWSAYAALPAADHFEKAGWLPCMAMLVNLDNARYDRHWYEPFPDPANPGKWVYRGVKEAGGFALGTEDQVGTGVFPPKPIGWSGDWHASPWASGDQYSLAVRTGAPHSLLLPTYEMRASYRDKAIDLWYAVAGGIPAFATAPVKGAAGLVPDVTDTQVDCDIYEYSPAALDQIVRAAKDVIDPHALVAGEFPPHPAQVLALSYLAHAAMLMTGWDVPFENRDIVQRLDWDCLTWHYLDEGDPATTADDEERAKDAKILAADAAAGQSSIPIRNDSPGREILLYAGDEICLEQDYRQWFRDAQPNPNQGAILGVTRYRVRADVRIAAGATASVDIEPNLVRDYTATTGVSAGNPRMNPPIPPSAGHPQEIIRVCNEYDRAFARTVHELCMRWAAAYASENPYDWGAPRMMNHQVVTDKPLALLDLFMDAAKGPASDGVAQRTPQDLPTATRVSPTESFYRWIMPANHAPRTWFKQGWTPTSGPVNAISHLGPNRNRETPWLSTVYNPMVAPPSTSAPTTTSQWDWTSDANRYWLNRPFAPFHRGRQLVYWAVDWKAYEDAETAPTATLDYSKHARAIRLKPDGVTVDTFYPMMQSGDTASNTSRQDSQFAGNPENGVLWIDGNRDRRYIDSQTNQYLKSFWTYTRESEDIVLGHWGADRNNNRKLDIGPVQRSARMRALTVARFNVYDPVLRVHHAD